MKATVVLSQQERLDILTDTLENGAIRYWAGLYRPFTCKRDKEHNVTELTFVAPNNTNGRLTKYTITPDTIQLGTDTLLKDSFEVADWIKLQILTGEYDIITDDVMIQAAIYGEIVYG